MGQRHPVLRHRAALRARALRAPARGLPRRPSRAPSTSCRPRSAGCCGPSPETADRLDDANQFAVPASLKRVWDFSAGGIRAQPRGVARAPRPRRGSTSSTCTTPTSTTWRADLETGVPAVAALRDEGLVQAVGVGSKSVEALDRRRAHRSARPRHGGRALHAARAARTRCWRPAATPGSGSSRRRSSTPALLATPRPRRPVRVRRGAARAARAGATASRTSASATGLRCRRPRCSSRCASRRCGASCVGAATPEQVRENARRDGGRDPGGAVGRARAAVVDAHLHVWDLERSEYAWLTPELGPLYATFTPEQAHAELEAAGIAAAVLVQAEDSERDTDVHARGCRAAPVDRRRRRLGAARRPRGGRAPARPPAAPAALPRRAAPRARRSARRLPRSCRACGDRCGCSPTAASRSTCPTPGPGTWPPTADLAAALPRPADRRRPPRQAALRAAPTGTRGGTLCARSPRARTRRPRSPACRCRAGRSRSTSVRPAWEVALELFGPARLMWGSDWPMTVPAGGYGHLDVMSALIGELSPHEQVQILSGTARSTYRI